MAKSSRTAILEGDKVANLRRACSIPSFRRHHVFKNMGDVLKQAQEMQAKMQALRQDLAQREVEGIAGGGMVRIAFNGCSEPLRVHIDPKVAGDPEMLEDLVLAAIRDAQQKVQELVQREMGNLAGPMAGAFGLPGM